jgi:hypothetical protein
MAKNLLQSTINKINLSWSAIFNMNLTHLCKGRRKVKSKKIQGKGKKFNSLLYNGDLVSIAAAVMQDQLLLEASSYGKPKTTKN